MNVFLKDFFTQKTLEKGGAFLGMNVFLKDFYPKNLRKRGGNVAKYYDMIA
jgi:hypothetical protein